MKAIYVVIPQTLNTRTDMYTKHGRVYCSSYKKALAEKDQIIAVNNGSNVSHVWGQKHHMATDLFEYTGDAWVSASEKIRVKMRIFIRKEEVN